MAIFGSKFFGSFMRRKPFLYFFCFFLLSPSVLRAFSSLPDSLMIAEPVLRSRFCDLEIDRVPEGILYDYGVTPVDYRDYNGLPNQNNVADFSSFYYILQGVNTSVVNDNASIINLDNLLSGMSSIVTNSNRVPVGMAIYKFSQITQNAISSGLLEFQESTSTLEDVYTPAGEWVNPYEECNLAAFSPYVNIVPATVVFDFLNAFRFTNQTITHITFNAGDGQGFRPVGSNSQLYVTYTSAGRKTLTLRVTLDTDEVLYARSYVEVLAVPTTFTPPVSDVYDVQTFTSSIESDGIFPQAKISIHYAEGNSLTTAPFIVAEGFDPFSDPLGLLIDKDENGENKGPTGYGVNNLCTFLSELDSLSTLRSRDIVYIDWLNSTCSIESNADILKQIIIWVNANKPANAKNTLMGRSMGGLIGRVALRQMEIACIPHEVTTFVTNDTPHLGANVPLGLVYFIQHLFSRMNNPLSAVFEAYLQLCTMAYTGVNMQAYPTETMRLRNGTGVKQMLRYYVNTNLEYDDTAFQSFQQALRNLGFPQGDAGSHIVNLCLSNGGENNYTDSRPYLGAGLWIGPGDTIIDIATIIHMILTGDISRLPFMGSVSSIGASVYVYPFSYAGAKVFEYHEGYKKELRWLNDPIYVDLHSLTFYAPSSIFPVDMVNGSYYELRGLLSLNSSENHNYYIAHFDYDFDLQTKIMFVPTVSSLCYKNGQLGSSDYYTHFETTGVNMDNIPFDGYRFFSSLASRHTRIYEGDVLFITRFEDITILENFTPANQKRYYLNNPSLLVTWSSSNTNVATIDASSGVLTPVGYGTTNIYATVNTSLGHFRLKKELIIPTPASISFPTYTLNSIDLTLETDYEFDTYRIIANASEPIPANLLPYINYCWGRKVGTSTSITWYENQGTSRVFTLPLYENHFFYFKVKYFDTSSTVYSIRCLQRPRIVPIDPKGYLYTEDLAEVIAQVKSNTVSASYVFHCLGQEVFFDHSPTLAELCRSLLIFDNFTNEVKRLKPWGEEDTIMVPYTYWPEGREEEALEEVIVFQYSPDIQSE